MVPTRIGQLVDSCTFAGFNRIENNIYAILVAPKETEAVKQISTSTITTSSIDGYTNTHSICMQHHDAIHYCKNLTIDSHSDFYLPSGHELLLCYSTLGTRSTLIFDWKPRLYTSAIALTIASRDSFGTLVTRYQYDYKFSLEDYLTSTINYRTDTILLDYIPFDEDFVCMISFAASCSYPDTGFNPVIVRPVRRILVV